jgi:hypothetical protein
VFGKSKLKKDDLAIGRVAHVMPEKSVKNAALRRVVVEGTSTEGSPGDPSGTYTDDPGNKVRDQGHQGGTRVSGEDSRVRTAPINGTMHTRTAPVNGTVCTQTAQSNGTVCTQTAPSNAWTVVSRRGLGHLDPLAGNVQEIRNLPNTQSLLLVCRAAMWVAGATLKP